MPRDPSAARPELLRGAPARRWSAAASTTRFARTARAAGASRWSAGSRRSSPTSERARVCVVPLLHGAGVKGKIVESMLAGTPVVTTPIGAEGLDLRDGEHAVIADTPAELADGHRAGCSPTREQWQRLADAGHELADARHAPATGGRAVPRDRGGGARTAEPPGAGVGADDPARARRELAYREPVSALGRRRSTRSSSPGRPCWSSHAATTAADARGTAHCALPARADGRWAGYHPARQRRRRSGTSRSCARRGARYFVFPGTAFWWLHHYRDLLAHLDGHYRRDPLERAPGRVRARRRRLDDAGARRPREAAERARRRARTHAGRATAAADSSRSCRPRKRFDVAQRWQPRRESRPPASRRGRRGRRLGRCTSATRRCCRTGFVDDFLGAAPASLAPLGVERVQPAHDGGPEAGPPVTERLLGVLAREIEAVTPLPVLAVRGARRPRARRRSSTRCRSALARAGANRTRPAAYSDVGDVFIGDAGSPARAPCIAARVAEHR